MKYLLVRHKVADFDVWKKVFDSHSEAQEVSGLKIEKLLRNIEDPNEVVMLFEVSDIEKARSFMATPEASAAKEASGVIDEPDAYFLS